MNNQSAITVREPGQNEIATTEEFSAFRSIDSFEQVQRMAKLLSSSSIVPDTYKGDTHIGDCVIAIELSNRIGASVLAVMQNLYIVYGRPAWSSQFLISCINASRRFSPLRYEETGEKGTDSWGRRAWATDKSGQVLKAPEITIAMAKAEGWYQKNGSKWKTMPELMLCYRTATLFARLYAPELTMGIQTDDEVIDISPVVTEQRRGISKLPEFTPATEVAAVAIVAPTAANGIQLALQTELEAARVSFEDFRKWADSSGRLADASSYGSFAELPDKFCETLSKDPIALGKCVLLHGKK